MDASNKPRSMYTPAEDVSVMKEVVGYVTDDGSGRRGRLSKQEWEVMAVRVTSSGVVLGGEALRRRVGDLVKKHKRDEANNAAGQERMRWGMAWPKSEEEHECDRLVSVYIKQLEQAKQQPKKPPAKVQTKKPAPAVVQAIPTIVAPTAPPPFMSSHAKRKDPSEATTITIEDDNEPFDYQFNYNSDTTLSSALPRTVIRENTASHDTIDSERLELKRRRLEMDERVQNRMLDIQTEQIALQREQLRFQAETLRALTDATQAIARALHALPKRTGS